MGSVVCSLPTAVLSTITGVFDGYSITDLTEQMIKTISHWESLKADFDIIYSGFLGSHEQVDVILSAIERFKGCYVIVDPVFADNGRLYPTMSHEMVKNMKRLVSRANLITPNFTEACFLLDENPETKADDNTLKKWLSRLCDMGPERCVITSCPLGKDICVAAYDRIKNEYWKLICRYIPIEFHGTGDIFTSVLTGAVARGDCFEAAISLSASFVRDAIDATSGEDWDRRYGLLIEKVLEKVTRPAVNMCERF